MSDIRLGNGNHLVDMQELVNLPPIPMATDYANMKSLWAKDPYKTKGDRPNF